MTRHSRPREASEGAGACTTPVPHTGQGDGWCRARGSLPRKLEVRSQSAGRGGRWPARVGPVETSEEAHAEAVLASIEAVLDHVRSREAFLTSRIQDAPRQYGAASLSR